ncbi:FAST kinase domain-containing protein 4 isoform X2 [Halyomorpha halys]|uniref:FAST kinase domain-containing protein 4 isoform X2 n=1 Tax=Halyomorpha halys TaxID=286706 RepID=UPI0006D4F827|nr:FAST kinase domain-containing protein 4 [Halyomorpha halys]
MFSIRFNIIHLPYLLYTFFKNIVVDKIESHVTFSDKYCYNMLRSSSMRYALCIFKQHQRCTSSIPTPALNSDKVPEEVSGDLQKKTEGGVPKETINTDSTIPRSNLVKKAFSNLKHNQPHLGTRSNIEELIKEAKTPDDLLQISEKNYITRGEALKIVSVLSEWSLKGRVDSNFESDPRFNSLCKLLGRNPKNRVHSKTTFQNEDLSFVLRVTGEDEAAKIIDGLGLPQMIKVLSSLSAKKRRSLPLLRSLAFHIGRIPSKLDVKQSADILYALSSLNFPDEVLLEKVCHDLVESLPVCQKSAVFGSICTSLGLLKYKDSEFLEVLCDWALTKKDLCRCQDLVSLLLCLSSVRHIPNQELLTILSQIKEGDLPSSSTWLDVVWSLAVLNVVTEAQLSSVLNSKFVDRLTSSAPGLSWKRKLLNLNGVAKWTKGYKGSLLSEDSNLETTVTKSKDKQQLIVSLLDSLSNLFPSSNYFKSCVDTGMGFLIDAECIVDSKMNPFPLIDKKTGQAIDENKSTKKNRIAIFIHDYHDCTRGRVELAGPAYFNTHLAGLIGYKVVNILYTDYNVRAKLIQRVQYLEGLLKSAVAEST